LQFLARRLDDDVHSRFQIVIFIRKNQLGLAASEEPREYRLEFFVDLLEAFFEPEPADAVQFDDRALQISDGFLKILFLLAHKLEAGVELFVFTNGGKVDFAHPLEPTPQVVDFRQQIFRRGHGFFAFEREILYVGIVSLADVGGEMLAAKFLFGQQHLEPILFFLAGFAQGPQLFYGLFDF
jgi:hypothetical protein